MPSPPCYICGEQNKLICGPCAGHLVLRNRINLVKAHDQLHQLQTAVTGSLEDPRAGALDARIRALETQLAHTRAMTARCRAQTAQTREQIVHHTTALMARRTEKRQRDVAHANEITAERSDLVDRITALERSYKHNFHQTLSYQSRALGDLLAIFTVRRRRRKHGQPPDTLLGFGIVPNAGALLQYSAQSLTAGLERVACFTLLCAGYLGVQLPYRIELPSKLHLDVHMIHADSAMPLTLLKPVRELLRNDPTELYAFCRAFAMLLIDVASLGARLGVPKLGLEDVARLNELVTHLVLRLASQVHAGVEIQVQSGVPSLDLDAVQDYLITQAEIGVNGGWVELSEPVGER